MTRQNSSPNYAVLPQLLMGGGLNMSAPITFPFGEGGRLNAVTKEEMGQQWENSGTKMGQKWDKYGTKTG